MVIGDVRMNGNMFNFEDYNEGVVEPDSSKTSANPNDGDAIRESWNETSTGYAYAEDPICRLLCIETPENMRAFKKIRDHFGLDFTDILPGSNPIIEVYDRWMEKWRLESINSSYEWRENVQTFQWFKRDRGVKEYLSKIEKLGFISFNPAETDARREMDREIRKWS